MPRIVHYADVVAKPEFAEQLAQLYKDVVPLIAAQEGVDFYAATRSVSDPNRFRVVEVYASQEALDNHIKGEHLPKMMKFIKDHDPLAAPFVFEKHTYVEA